ncbi:hypothetical protein ADN00_12310 [Ornatilinea apprima]|nr:hypothetical protein ADN00_12310 [Ornatilinea apprima]
MQPLPESAVAEMLETPSPGCADPFPGEKAREGVKMRWLRWTVCWRAAYYAAPTEIRGCGDA